jgi:hypothetical protein
MSRRRTTLVIAVLIMAFTGCAKRHSVTAGTIDVQGAAADAPVGTEFTVSMNRAIGTLQSREGEPFTATVDTPIVAQDNKILVPRGALLHGKIARVESGEALMLALDFERIETVRGTAEIHAELRTAERFVVWGPDHRSGLHDAAFYPPNAWPVGQFGSDLAYYEYAFAFYDPIGRAIRIPRGADLDLVLTQPLRLHPSRPR